MRVTESNEWAIAETLKGVLHALDNPEVPVATELATQMPAKHGNPATPYQNVVDALIGTLEVAYRTHGYWNSRGWASFTYQTWTESFAYYGTLAESHDAVLASIPDHLHTQGR